MGKGPRHGVPHMAAQKWEILFIIYTHNGAASASRATKAGREGGYGGPRALAEELGSMNSEARGGAAPNRAESNGAMEGAGPRRASGRL